jgi:hypothetical protein
MVKICTNKKAVLDGGGIIDVDAVFAAWVQKDMLDAVFDLAEGMDIRLLLLHTRLGGCRNRDFLLNDRVRVSNISDLIIEMGKAL